MCFVAYKKLYVAQKVHVQGPLTLQRTIIGEVGHPPYTYNVFLVFKNHNMYIAN